MNNIITIEEIVTKEIESNNFAISILNEISELLSKETIVKTNYRYSITRPNEEDVNIRMYSLIKHIFKSRGWILEMNWTRGKDKTRIYNIALSPINIVYV